MAPPTHFSTLSTAIILLLFKSKTLFPSLLAFFHFNNALVITAVESVEIAPLPPPILRLNSYFDMLGEV